MQYWIFGHTGSGYIEISNLIEHADNVYPADGQKLWKNVDRNFKKRQIGWMPPRWVNIYGLFEAPQPDFDPSDYILNPVYLKLLEEGKNTVIPAHYRQYLNYIDLVPFKDTITKDMHKIFVSSSDKQRMINDIAVNHPNLTDQDKIKAQAEIIDYNPLTMQYFKPEGGYDTIIELERVWEDWNYLNNILTAIGINLQKKFYDTYMEKSNAMRSRS